MPAEKVCLLALIVWYLVARLDRLSGLPSTCLFKGVHTLVFTTKTV